jgi:broad specificity phosphatase PhoE
MTEIYLLRHGETPWNADRNRYCGRTDIPLSQIGRAQAAALREALVSVPLAAMYVSPLARSRETGEIIAAGRQLPLHKDPRLIEIDFGGWEGLPAADIAGFDPVGRAAWLHDPTATRAGGTGETAAEVSERMTACLAEIAARHEGEAVAVVGHNTANRHFLAAALDAPLRSYRQLVLDNASISLVEIGEGGTRLVRLNDVTHLGGAERR